MSVHHDRMPPNGSRYRRLEGRGLAHETDKP
jgi:hypothetical protein